MSAAAIPTHLLPTIYTDADWAFDFLFTDDGVAASFAGSTFSLAMAPRSSALKERGFIVVTEGGGITLTGNRIGVRVAAATMAARFAGNYKFELREHKASGAIVALATGVWTIEKGASQAVVEGVQGGGVVGTGIGSVTVNRTPQGVQVVRAGAGPAGKSAYELAVDGGYVGTLEQWLVATGASGTAEASRVTAEGGRVTAETGRVAAEGGRVTAEGLRISHENDRQDFATALSIAATGWSSAEGGRASAESGRVSAETGRAAAETTRSNNETTRGTAETARGAAETGRVNAESTRVTQETARQTNTAAAIAATVELPIRVISATTGAIDSNDAGKVIECTHASGCVVTVAKALPAKFVCEVRQAAAGQVTLLGEAGTPGATLRNADSLLKTRRQWASATLHCRANSDGSSAEVVVTGDLST